MSLFDWSILAIAALLTGVSLTPRLRNNRWWSATVTPLASIIGSGFLVVAPLLASVAGSYALEAMLLIVMLAFFVGAVIRFNIRHSEPLENSRQGPAGLWLLALLANAGLTLAYVISVAFYIRLLASFAFSMTPFASESREDWFATAILIAIALIGWFRGLRGLESVETISVSVKLSIIAALLASLAWFNFGNGVWAPRLTPEDVGIWTHLQMLGGMLLLVQGFETSRYLGAAYPAEMRCKTMFWAQISSGLIYLAFVALVVPLLSYLPAGKPDETAIVTITGNVAWVLPPLLVLAALMSQLSAGIADTVGAGQLVVEETGRRLRERTTYPVLIALSIGLIWLFDIFQVIAIASRAFASYYLLQTLIALVVSRRVLTGARLRWAQAGLTALAVLLALIAIFALPAG